MKLEYVPEEFEKAKKVLQIIHDNGYEAYFVGGSVRDALLGKPIHDVDIATSAYPAEIKQMFKRTIDVGIEHGTILILVDNEEYEITTFRTESTYQDYRRPDEVTFVRSLEEDLKRRDFTINALAMTEDGQIIDLFDGIADISNEIIRAVGNPQERFHEDALRMMRGLRFASQLDFTIEADTLDAMTQCHFLLEKISVERISIELIKLLLGQSRQKALLPFVQTNCYQYCPKLKFFGDAILRFADLPKRQITTELQAWTLFIKILHVPSQEVHSFLKEWKLSNQSIQQVKKMITGLDYRLLNGWQPLMLYRLGLDIALATEELLVYFLLKEDQLSAKEAYQRLPIHSRKELAITGNDLLKKFNRKPGKWLGHLLEEIESAVVDGQVKNDPKVLLDFACTILVKE